MKLLCTQFVILSFVCVALGFRADSKTSPMNGLICKFYNSRPPPNETLVEEYKEAAKVVKDAYIYKPENRQFTGSFAATGLTKKKFKEQLEVLKSNMKVTDIDYAYNWSKNVKTPIEETAFKEQGAEPVVINIRFGREHRVYSDLEYHRNKYIKYYNYLKKYAYVLVVVGKRGNLTDLTYAYVRITNSYVAPSGWPKKGSELEEAVKFFTKYGKIPEYLRSYMAGELKRDNPLVEYMIGEAIEQMKGDGRMCCRRPMVKVPTAAPIKPKSTGSKSVGSATVAGAAVLLVLQNLIL